MPGQADISRRMLRRLEDIDNSTTTGPATQPRAALATSVVAHAVVDLEVRMTEPS
ncbi:hypothetical protein [Mycobacterium sp.]|uniref:hypothetical protein n=1 Tax=Mycobacterium sp. TaxID=1785 RepID=UPI003F99D764